MPKAVAHIPAWILNQKEEKIPERGLFNIAVYQENLDICNDLIDAFPQANLQFHHFSKPHELVRYAQRYILDLIIIVVENDFGRTTRLVNEAREQMFLSIVPLIIYNPTSAHKAYKQALECEADDLLMGEWNREAFATRIQMLMSRSRRDLGVNPSSRLPGPSMIEKKINQMIANDKDFAVCYLDIDNFKGYNDYYGYFYGDKVIRLTAQIVRDVVFDLVPNGFVGHVGGDDFIFVIPYQMIDMVCSNTIKTFDRIIPYRYKEEDRLRGKIVTKNRFGEDEIYSMLTISIAVLVCENKIFSHAGEMSHMLADLKKYTKKLAGSNYMIERRKKY
ncbi:MAG: diguanylate cyclase [candidate division Zixibacteria bacterium]|nr:diguanylate cyclase [candidate division Zixibacteria bacterium]